VEKAMKKKSFALLFILILVFSSNIQLILSPVSVFAAEEKPRPHPLYVVVDIPIVRPVQLILATGGLVLYPVGLLLDRVLQRDPEGLWKKWVSEPFSLFGKRPLGDFTWSPE
jgi:hypothetical protein